MWQFLRLRDVAPPVPSARSLEAAKNVWLLSLDQIEPHTGRILSKLRVSPESVGASTFLFDQENVLYSKLRPYLNKVVRPDEVGIATTELVPLRPTATVLNPDFLAYYLRSAPFLEFASRCVVGAKMPRVIMDRFWDRRVPLPPLSEQRRIVEILDQADDMRRKRVEADAKTDRILAALFYQTFGNPATNPKHWPLSKVGDVISDTRNGLYKPLHFYGSGTPILKMFNIRNGRLELTRVDRIALEPEEQQDYALTPGDILINRVNTKELVGKCAVIPDSLGDAVFESKNIRVRINRELADPEYVGYYLNSPTGHRLLRQGVKHAIGMATINNSDLAGTPMPLPPLPLQRFWRESIEKVSGIRLLGARSGDIGERLFLILSHRAFSAELTSRWRDGHAEELLLEMAEQAKELARTPEKQEEPASL